MKYGVLTTNIADIWSRSKFNSERLSQLFFGSPVKIHSLRSGYNRISESDGYSGWVNSNFIGQITYAEYKKLKDKQNIFVNTKNCILKDFNRRKSVEPFQLYYGTKLYAVKDKSGDFKISLSDRKYIINAKSVTKISKKKPTASQIIKEAKRFLGVPYLWGGISNIGFDCSGFVRTILSKYGVCIPRDTKDQIKCGRKINRDLILPGDLLFFNRHVGIALGNERLIHSSVSGGGVRINSLDKSKKDYRHDLDRDFKEARRLL